jgi:release factor glutamine methyltransferase
VEVDPVAERLRAAGCVWAEDEAALLRTEAIDDVELDAWVARREAGEPIEIIVGWAEFRGLRLRVAPGVFVPRARTGAVVDAALRRILPGDVVVDLCCGVGAIGAAIAAEGPEGVELVLADIDPAALECAGSNVPQAFVAAGDLYAALPRSLRGRVAVIAANAPYVPSDDIPLMPREARSHEHRVALDGGLDGLDLHRRIAADARDWLAPGGVLLIETSRAQAEGTTAAMRDAGLAVAIERRDEVDGTVAVGVAPVG